MSLQLSATLPLNSSFSIQNKNRQVRKITQVIEDSIVSNRKNRLNRTQAEIKSELNIIKNTKSNYLDIDKHIKRRGDLFSERNKILDSFFKYYNPFYRKKLKKIDLELDKLEMEIYLLQQEKNMQDLNLDKILLEAEQIRQKYLS